MGCMMVHDGLAPINSKAWLLALHEGWGPWRRWHWERCAAAQHERACFQAVNRVCLARQLLQLHS